MPKKWFLGSGNINFVVTRRSDLYPPEASTLDPKTFDENFDKWAGDAELQQTLLDIYRVLSGRTVSLATSDADALKQIRKPLDEAFRSQELVMLRTRPRVIFPRIKEQQASAQAGGADDVTSRKKTTWIEIELIDENNKPVPEEQYRIEMPDGSIEDGFLDAQGRAYIDGLEPGTCKVSFPKIDGNEWRQV